MAIDIAAQCSIAAENHGTQTLAIVLSAMFSAYTIITIALTAITIYSTSQAVNPPQSPTVVDAIPIGGDAAGARGAVAPSLVSLRTR